jgi:hypothetical protein
VVIVTSGFGDVSRTWLDFALLAAARTSAIELLKVRGIAPEDSVFLKSCELLLFFCGAIKVDTSFGVISMEGLDSLSSLARLGVEVV